MSTSGKLRASSISEGTKGKVLQLDEGDNPWCLVTMLREQREGWVPRNCLAIGKIRKFGEVQYNHDTLMILPGGRPQLVSSASVNASSQPIWTVQRVPNVVACSGLGRKQTSSNAK